MPKLENECFLKAEIISPFGDLKIKLSNSIEITTFFRYFAEDQWVFFMPDNNYLEFDCCNHNELEFWSTLPFKHPSIHSIGLERKYILKKIIFLDNKTILEFNSCLKIIINLSTWRLKRNSSFILGDLDDFEREQSILFDLIEKELTAINLSSDNYDIYMSFEQGFTIEVFTCSLPEKPWEIIWN